MNPDAPYASPGAGVFAINGGYGAADAYILLAFAVRCRRHARARETAHHSAATIGGTAMKRIVKRRPRWSRNAALMRSAVATSVFLLRAVSDANAADQGIAGTKLLLKSTAKLVVLARDPSISIGGSDPIGGADSSLRFDDGSIAVTFGLPASLWSTNGAGTLFKYKNASAPGGPSAVKLAKLKPGLIKVVANALPFAVPNGAASIDVVLSLDGGTNTYCMTFSGTGDGSTFLARDASAGTCAGGGAVCGDDVREGTEDCDGGDATACPDACLPDCSCAAACPAGGGNPLACYGYATRPNCTSCCNADVDCAASCTDAIGALYCDGPSQNDACTNAANAAGCAAECCP